MNNKKIVRIYQYSDPHKCWGDAGTFGYILMDNDCFENQKQERFDGSIWERTILTEKGNKQLNQTEGYDYYIMGWEIVSQEFYENEVKKLKEKLNRMLLK